jgi:hypothetical protein
MKCFNLFLASCFTIFLSVNKITAQVCGVSGFDGPTNATSVINTYYPPLPNSSLSIGSTSVQLSEVPSTDRYGNSFGNIPISAGDLLIIIQIQDGTINTSNSKSYGSGNANSGPDALGATGYTSLGNAGKYEYLIALNNVPLNGGILQFRGAGNNQGIVNSYLNSTGNGNTLGQKTFQGHL